MKCLQCLWVHACSPVIAHWFTKCGVWECGYVGKSEKKWDYYVPYHAHICRFATSIHFEADQLVWFEVGHYHYS